MVSINGSVARDLEFRSSDASAAMGTTHCPSDMASSYRPMAMIIIGIIIDIESPPPPPIIINGRNIIVLSPLSGTTAAAVLPVCV
jgi:hypothetical protein